MRLELKTGHVGTVLKVDGAFFSSLPMERKEEVLHTIMGGLDHSYIEGVVRLVLSMVPPSSLPPEDVPGQGGESDKVFWDFT